MRMHERRRNVERKRLHCIFSFPPSLLLSHYLSIVLPSTRIKWYMISNAVCVYGFINCLHLFAQHCQWTFYFSTPAAAVYPVSLFGIYVVYALATACAILLVHWMQCVCVCVYVLDFIWNIRTEIDPCDNNNKRKRKQGRDADLIVPVPYTHTHVDVACAPCVCVHQNEKLTAENNGNTAKIK